MCDVVALGELLIDFIPAGGGEDEPCLKAMAGGAPGNFAAAVQAYGLQSALISKVGKDAFGDLLVSRFAKLGVETRGIVQDDHVFTTLAFVTLSEDGDRAFSFARKPGADTCLSINECDFTLIEACKLFHFGTLSLTHEPARTATKAAIAYAKEQGKMISFDPNLRIPLWDSLDEAREQILWGLGQADIVKISDDEVGFLFGCGVEEGATHIVEGYGVKLVFVTCGPQGCYFAGEHVRGRVESPPVQAVDTTGAGDIFFGAAVSRLLKHKKEVVLLSEDELCGIARFACTAASLSTKKHGGISSISAESNVLMYL